MTVKTGGCSGEAWDPQNKHSQPLWGRSVPAATGGQTEGVAPPPLTQPRCAVQTSTPGTLSLPIDLPPGLSNACLHLKDYFITWFVSAGEGGTGGRRVLYK